MTVLASSRQRSWQHNRLSIALGATSPKDSLRLLAQLAADTLPPDRVSELKHQLAAEVRATLPLED